MLLKSTIIFVICNYMRKILNMNMCKVYVNYKPLFIERQYYIFMSLAQCSCAVAVSSRENRLNLERDASISPSSFYRQLLNY